MSKTLESQNPFSLLLEWYEEAKTTQLKDPNALVLSTHSEDGFPRSRVVLAKQIDENGIIVYTNYESEKGKAIESNPKVAINFYWEALGKQIRISGTASKTSRQKSVDYWSQRPRGSQLSQYISQQSEALSSREELESQYSKVEAEFEGKPIPCPEHWGGYLIAPHEFEFWIADDRRLHNRFVFKKNASQEWLAQRLFP